MNARAGSPLTRAGWVVLVLVLVLVGCGRYAEEREVCDAYLDCASEVDPSGTGALVRQYGRKGACWDDPDQAALCVTACRLGAGRMLADADAQREQCLVAAAGPEPEPIDCSTLDEDGFGQAFSRRMCVESASCGDGEMADGWCSAEGSDADCTFDATAACDCLEGAYTCSDLGDFAFVEAPEICGRVWDCPTSTR